MSLVAWSDKLSVHVPTIDAQHKTLIALLNELHEAMKLGKANEVTADILARLLNYTHEHFATEEQLMQRSAYPNYPQHKALHEALIKQALDIQTQIQAGKLSATLKLSTFLKDWLVQHIQSADLAFGTFLSAKGSHRLAAAS